MLRKANNVFSVLLDDSGVTTLPSVGTVVTDANLSTGAVVLVDAGHRRTTLSALANGDTFFIAQGKGTGKKLMISPAITKGKTAISVAPHKAAQQQITAIGYNGTTGSLPTANDTSFFIKIRKNDNDAANRSQPMSLFAQFKTDATGTQEELAFGLAKNGIKNFADEPANGYVKFEVISDGTLAAIGTATLAATYGSKTLTYSAAHGLSVGALVFIAGATYKVAAVPSTTTVTLNMPFQGTTVTALATGTTYATTHGSVSAATNFGIRITGVAAPFDVNAFRDYYANRFTATFSDESTLVTHVQGAFNGNGVWQQVAMDEYMSYGYEGQNDMLAVPPRFRDQVVKTVPAVAAVDAKYSAINIAWEESISGLVSLSGGKGNVLIYVNLTDNAGTGELAGTGSTGETLASALGLTPADLDE